MSTLFIIPANGVEIETDETGEIKNSLREWEYIPVASRWNGGMLFKPPFDRMYHLLSPDIKVYPSDNTPQGIYTLGDIIKEIEEQNERQQK